MRVLTLNAGSSSLKASLIDDGRTVATANVPSDGTHDGSVVAAAIDATGATGIGVDAIGHRVVHGGDDLVAPARIDDEVIERIRALSALAPLHNDPALATIRSARSLIPDRPHVACFDTAFHARLPEVARRYPVPEQWRTRWGIRRFGFHGLSVEWSVRRAQDLLGRAARGLDLVVAHLGSGCSVTATAGGESAWTSMGFTPLDGLMMRTRSGAIDPGIIIHLLRRGDLSLDGLADALEHRSGLVAVGGHGGDVRELQEAADEGDERAALALDLFAASAAGAIAFAATRLERLDAVVFTGGIGEHAGPVRATIARRLAILGIPTISDQESRDDRVIHPGPPAVLRVEAREDLVIAEAVAALVRADDAPLRSGPR
ncbi:MAG TPA: acetate/propionate family kinase [Candidatus Limnocylindrales bacterium]